MDNKCIIFFQICFASILLFGSENNSKKIVFEKDRLDKVFKNFGLAEYNEITRMSQKIAEKEKSQDQLEVAIFLSFKSYEEYLKEQSFLLCKQYNLSFEKNQNYTKAALEEFEKKKKDAVEILKLHNDIRSSFIDNEV